jgi:hypothetical protein
MDHQNELSGCVVMALRLDDRENADVRFTKRTRNLREHTRPILDRQAKVVSGNRLLDRLAFSVKVMRCEAIARP